MSATDSDNSIDWLASDNEESDSGVTEKRDLGPPDSSCSSSMLREGDRMRKEVREVSSWGSPSCTERRDRASATGLCRKQQGGKAEAEKALKRPHSSSEEQRREQQLFCSEKDRIFSEKVSNPVTHICYTAALLTKSAKLGNALSPRLAPQLRLKAFPVKTTLPHHCRRRRIFFSL